MEISLDASSNEREDNWRLSCDICDILNQSLSISPPHKAAFLSWCAVEAHFVWAQCTSEMQTSIINSSLTRSFKAFIASSVDIEYFVLYIYSSWRHSIYHQFVLLSYIHVAWGFKVFHFLFSIVKMQNVIINNDT